MKTSLERIKEFKDYTLQEALNDYALRLECEYWCNNIGGRLIFEGGKYTYTDENNNSPLLSIKDLHEWMKIDRSYCGD